VTVAQATAISPDVYVAEDRIVQVGQSDVEFLKEQVHRSERKRVRLCAHKDLEDRLQEMVIVFAAGTYIRPSRHINKEESVHIVEGLADFVFFDETGRITEVIPLGDYASARQFYCRTPESMYHTMLVRSDVLVVQETTQGPFRRSDTLFAPWAPEDHDTAAVGKYIMRLAIEVDEFLRRKGKP
jgi:cupin fold WbuC family metalloprotein